MVPACRFDGFYADGRYFEASVEQESVCWSCTGHCEKLIRVTLHQLRQQKFGFMHIGCPDCHRHYQLDVRTLNNQPTADISEVN